MSSFLRENESYFVVIILVCVLMLVWKTFDLQTLIAKVAVTTGADTSAATQSKAGIKNRSGMCGAGMYTSGATVRITAPENSQGALYSPNSATTDVLDKSLAGTNAVVNPGYQGTPSSGFQPKRMYRTSGMRSGMGGMEPPVFWNPGSYAAVGAAQSAGIVDEGVDMNTPDTSATVSGMRSGMGRNYAGTSFMVPNPEGKYSGDQLNNSLLGYN